MKDTFFNRCFLRYYVLINGNLDGCPLKDFEENKAYSMLGFRDDAELSAKDRFILAKAVSEHDSSDKEFFKSLLSKFPNTHTFSKLREQLDQEGLLFYFPSLDYNSQLLNIFKDKAGDFINLLGPQSAHVYTNVLSSGEPLRISDLLSLFSQNNLKDFSEYASSILPDNVMEVKTGKSKIEDGIITVPSSLRKNFSDKEIITISLFLILVKGSCIPDFNYLPHVISKSNDFVNLFVIGHEAFLELLGFTWKSKIDMFDYMSINKIDPNEMLNAFDCIFMGNPLDYSCNIIPNVKCKTALPANVTLDKLTEMLNSSQIKDITYRNGVPYLNHLPLISWEG